MKEDEEEEEKKLNANYLHIMLTPKGWIHTELLLMKSLLWGEMLVHGQVFLK